ncbi:MAG TPA: saccharopine dehydrogenase NADP-binding domain-containing protein, partial [Thermoanaerobaculia bacterium]|nr:saccharopine dehydrogenase NADP-binding domain-containing protein [Thermoanaerobaculia bacterium]
MKRLLVLGAGLVSPPLIRYFLPRRDVAVVVASLDFSRIERLVEGHRGRVDLVATDVNDPAAVGKLVSESDAVVSLLPAHLL